MAGHTYSKNGQIGLRKGPVGKSVSEQTTEFGETVQLPGGVDPSRKFTRNYTPGAPESTGAPIPPSSLYDR